MISKNTFVTMIDTISEVIEESKAMCRLLLATQNPKNAKIRNNTKLA